MFRYMSKKDRRIKNLEAMVKNRDEKIEQQWEMICFLNEALDNANDLNKEHQKINGELMEKIKDLENNIEFLTNNLSAQKRKQLGL